ncbi:hypothetical protein [Streptomyces boluensis]|uniref:Uncharacterized protein n=1 Tax=Streptomyces boluensis TaxID=1775135 RepID=A0A964UTT4_9ACTN|nr:hypothetical protein [Streptomyces boluensis]NBE55308.1 hypothetical protein [Streptomyces boluensis]
MTVELANRARESVSEPASESVSELVHERWGTLLVEIGAGAAQRYAAGEAFPRELLARAAQARLHRLSLPQDIGGDGVGALVVTALRVDYAIPCPGFTDAPSLTLRCGLSVDPRGERIQVEADCSADGRLTLHQVIGAPTRTLYAEFHRPMFVYEPCLVRTSAQLTPDGPHFQHHIGPPDAPRPYLTVREVLDGTT